MTGKRIMMVEVLDHGHLRNVEFDDCTSPDEARNNVAALRMHGITPTGVYAFIEVDDGVARRVGSLTETIRHHFLDIKAKASFLR